MATEAPVLLTVLLSSNVTYLMSNSSDNMTYYVTDSDSSTGSGAQLCGDHANPCTFKYADWNQIPGVTEALMVLYIIMATCAILGNGLIMWSILRLTKMRTVTNVYIFNLALSDTCIGALVMPFKYLEYGASHEMTILTSNTVCKLHSYVLPVFVFSNVLTLVAINIERYYVIVHPFSSLRRMQNLNRTIKIVIITWIISAIVAIPYALFSEVKVYDMSSKYGRITRAFCADGFEEVDDFLGYGKNHPARFRRVFFTVLFVMFYLIPMLVIGYTTLRIVQSLIKIPSVGQEQLQTNRVDNKAKVAKMVIMVAVVFFISWTPKYIVNMLSQYQQVSFLKKSNYSFTMSVMHLIGFLNSALDPIIYLCMSRSLRESCVSAILVSGHCRRPDNVTSTESVQRPTGTSIRFLNRPLAQSPHTERICLDNRKPRFSKNTNKPNETSDITDMKEYRKIARKISTQTGIITNSNESLSKKMLRRLSQSSLLNQTSTDKRKLSRDELNNWTGSMNCLLDIQLDNNCKKADATENDANTVDKAALDDITLHDKDEYDCGDDSAVRDLLHMMDDKENATEGIKGSPIQNTTKVKVKSDTNTEIRNNRTDNQQCDSGNGSDIEVATDGDENRVEKKQRHIARRQQLPPLYLTLGRKSLGILKTRRASPRKVYPVDSHKKQIIMRHKGYTFVTENGIPVVANIQDLAPAATMGGNQMSGQKSKSNKSKKIKYKHCEVSEYEYIGNQRAVKRNLFNENPTIKPFNNADQISRRLNYLSSAFSPVEQLVTNKSDMYVSILDIEGPRYQNSILDIEGPRYKRDRMNSIKRERDISQRFERKENLTRETWDNFDKDVPYLSTNIHSRQRKKAITHPNPVFIHSTNPL